jgi:hypothetical protein
MATHMIIEKGVTLEKKLPRNLEYRNKMSVKAEFWIIFQIGADHAHMHYAGSHNIGANETAACVYT